MTIDPVLKPLYANLKRLNLGEYLETREFRLFMLEAGFDDAWKACTQAVADEYQVVMLGFHSTEDDEKAFAYFLTVYIAQYPIANFLLPVLHNFAIWKPIKLDYSRIIACLRDLNVSDAELNKFIDNDIKIQQQKPVELKEEKVIPNKGKAPLLVTSNKVFVVHGHDDVSRLELCNLLREEFKLEPVVLQDKPNNSFDTIIGKFERLASDCSVAVVLFTPDDDAGDNKRARQNVIFELGYFLGKFQGEHDRKIIMLKKGNVEIPSDISGVLYLQYNNAVKEVYYDLKKQLQHWGYSF